MTTATITNDNPLTADLEFDLGDVLKCELPRIGCPREAVWLCVPACGGEIAPSCDQCRREFIEDVARGYRYRYGHCVDCHQLVSPEHYQWRKL